VHWVREEPKVLQELMAPLDSLDFLESKGLLAFRVTQDRPVHKVRKVD